MKMSTSEFIPEEYDECVRACCTVRPRECYSERTAEVIKAENLNALRQAIANGWSAAALKAYACEWGRWKNQARATPIGYQIAITSAATDCPWARDFRSSFDNLKPEIQKAWQEPRPLPRVPHKVSVFCRDYPLWTPQQRVEIEALARQGYALSADAPIKNRCWRNGVEEFLRCARDRGETVPTEPVYI